MKRSFVRSPYLWAIVGVVAVVSFAWVTRHNRQPVITGNTAPAFTALNMDGDEVELADYLGDYVVLVNIWATWCPPCVEEMPSMERLYAEFPGEAFEILAVSVDAPIGQVDRREMAGGDVAAFAEQFGLTFPILHDPEGDIEDIYQTTGVPESFLIGKDGLIHKKVAGETAWDAPANVELIRRLVGS
ncbi:MAG: TlpA disulfide reductase family protein [Gemmatimonadota bacterium]